MDSQFYNSDKVTSGDGKSGKASLKQVLIVVGSILGVAVLLWLGSR